MFAVVVAGVRPRSEPAVLIAARGVQGVGAAAMFATTIALLSTSYQGRDRGHRVRRLGRGERRAAAVGPILGGLLTEGLSWRWIFFVNLPVSGCCDRVGLSALSRDEPRPARGRVDLPGMARVHRRGARPPRTG